MDSRDLQRRWVAITLFNFFLLSLVGVLMRAWSVFSIPFLQYKNVVHAHSHFAFGGWVIPGLMVLIIHFFPALCQSISFHHWRTIFLLMLGSAYGMLFSFPFQGYGPVSIVFSTISLAACFYLGILIFRAVKMQADGISHSFLKAGFFYCFLSAIGPFATGPLIAMGKAGSPLYFNVIYFYLHFQYNGFFSFIILAVLYKLIEQQKEKHHGRLVFILLNCACVPSFFLSVLWTKPSFVFNLIGGAAALLQIVGVFWLIKDMLCLKLSGGLQKWLFGLAGLAFILKIGLQLLSALPGIAQLAYQNRDFVIAYLHLVLLGFVSLCILAAIYKSISVVRFYLFRMGIVLFITALCATESLLVLHAWGYTNFLHGVAYSLLLLGFSFFFPVGLLFIWRSVRFKDLSF